MSYKTSRLIKNLLVGCSLFGTSLSATSATVVGSIPADFSVNNGAFNYSIPIQVPAGRGGMQPDLSINYSGGGNGVLGLGWSLGGLSAITRCPATRAQDGFIATITFTDKDRYCLDGQRLVSVNGINGAVGTVYKTEVDGYSKITSYGGTANNPDYWVVHTKAGQVITYGGDHHANQTFPQGHAVWAVREINDSTANNPITYTYEIDEYTQYLSAIEYTGGRIEMGYQTGRADYTKAYFLGNGVKMTRRMHQVRVFSATQRLRTYHLAYASETKDNRSQLSQISVCDTQNNCTPPTTFSWESQALEFQSDVLADMDIGSAEGRDWADVNGDGLSDYCRVVGSAIHCTLSIGDGFGKTIKSSHLDAGNGDARWWVDFNADGLADYCRLVGGGIVRCTLSTGSGFGETISSVSLDLGYGEGRAWVDINGDARPDYCRVIGGRLFRDSRIQCTVSEGSHFGATITSAMLDWGHADKRWWVDFNGDGLSDFCRSVGGNHNQRISCTLSTGTNFGETIMSDRLDWGYSEGRSWADMNGDGLADYCRVVGVLNNQRVGCTLSTGTDFGETIWSDRLNWGNGDSRWWIDVNADGFTDYCRRVNNDGWLQVACTLSTGTDFSITIYSDGLIQEYREGRSWADINGDGRIDFCRAYEVNEFIMYTAFQLMGPRSGVSRVSCTTTTSGALPKITAITAAAGATTSIRYAPLTDPSVYIKGKGSVYPIKDLQAPQYVVSQVETSNGIGGTSTVNYHYQGLKAHLRGRGSYGFAKVTAHYPDTGKTRETYTNQTVFPYVGLVDRVVELYNGIMINESTKTYHATEHGGVHQVSLVESTDNSYELDGQLITRVTTQHSDLDTYGNIGTVNVSTTATNPVTGTEETFSKTTHSTYTNDTARWYLGRLRESTVTHSAPNQSNKHRSSTFAYDTTTGLLTSEAIVSTVSGQTLTTTQYQYDAYGQKNQVTVSATGESDRVTTTAYTSEGKPKQTCNALNQCETYTYTPEGWLAATTGPNQITTQWQYDGFGRKIRETRADGTQTTIARHFAREGTCGILANHVETCTISQTTGSQPVIVQYDALGRERRKITTGFDRRLIYTDTEYNALAQVARVSRNYFMGDHIYWANSQYDALGRVTQMDEPAAHGTRNRIHTAYNGLVTTVTSGPEARQKSTYTNAMGQVIRRSEEEGSYLEYTYTADGNLNTTVVADNAATTITLGYDEFGRKISMSDPDMGDWSYRYNAFGQLISQTDAKNQTTTMAYDVLGRMISRTDLANTDNAKTSTWTYGDNNAPQGSIGKLIAESDGAISKSYYYDHLGRPEEVNTTIKDGIIAKNFSTQTHYDSLGRVSRTLYPGSDHFYTENRYNDQGFLESVRGPRATTEHYDLNQITPLVSSALNLAQAYTNEANALRDIGQHYQAMIAHYQGEIATNPAIQSDHQPVPTIINLSHGTTNGLTPGKAYPYFSAGNGVYYIQNPDTFVPIYGHVLVPIMLPATHHYKLIDHNGQKVLAQVSAEEFTQATLTLQGNMSVHDSHTLYVDSHVDTTVQQLAAQAAITQAEQDYPAVTAQLAQAQQSYQTIVDSLARRVADQGWHFTSGTTAGISAGGGVRVDKFKG